MALDFFRKLFARKDTVQVPDEDAVSVVPESQEHRSADRDGTYKVATVTYPSGYVRKGVVVDRSETGVRVRFHTRGELPDHVHIAVEGFGGRKLARVAWQDVHEAGLAFDEEA